MGHVFYACLMTETNSFSPLETTLTDFKAGDYFVGQEVIETDGQVRLALKAIADWSDHHGASLIGGLSASAPPGGPIPHSDYIELKNTLLSQLEAAHPVQAVVLSLHGAMQSDRCFDCEGDILNAIRQVVGPDVPIGVVLDPHAHLTQAMVDTATCLVFMKEYPHTDGAERMSELLAIMSKALCEPMSLHAARLPCDLVSFFPTLDQPMRGFVDALQEAETDSDIASISFVHGFPWGDTPDMGAQLLVYSWKSQQHARTVALTLNDQLQSIKSSVIPKMIDVPQAMHLARRTWDKPLILADVADNPGGGAPSDNTVLLSALLENEIDNVALGLFFDPLAVACCHEAGIGKQVALKLGGKHGPTSGTAIHCNAQVRSIAKAARMIVAEGIDFPMGDTAWIKVEGVDVILSSLREQMYAPDGFAHLGLDPGTRNCLVVKSSNHFRAFFSPIASRCEYVTSPGAIDFNFARLPYRHFKGLSNAHKASGTC